MSLQIDVKGANQNDAIDRQIALQKLQDNITTENLEFLALMSKRKDVNLKIQNKKTLIKTFL